MSEKKAQAKRAIEDSGVLTTLRDYTPEVVSTIFVEMDTQHSDIDIVCYHQKAEHFEADFASAFGSQENYRLIRNGDTQIGHFTFYGFLVEVYSTPTPVPQQMGYCHFHIST